MIPLSDLLNRLGYDESPYYRRTDDDLLQLETAHLFRAAREADVNGIYVFETSPGSKQKLLPSRPAVYVAESNTENEARQIHRRLWNLGFAPFLIVRLPHQIRIYTGFNFSQENKEDGLLDKAEDQNQLQDILTNLAADSIDAGRIWKSKYAEKLNPNQRVDKRLLKSLEQLGQVLKADGLRDEVAHALIGKYVYLSYLRDRDILTDQWLMEKRIDPESVFTFRATISSLRNLVEVLEDRFNGRIFPIEFDQETKLKDKHVSWVASIFKGDKILDTAPDDVRQLHLPFKAYDFYYIPVETLSTIYEQFIHEKKKKGAIYTPEILADYLLSEVDWAKPLKRGMKILDPACGSGVFLVLAYRRLIEKEMNRLGRRLQPEELRDILLESIYGVERERDACYVAEFSLILTLLHYTEPRDLQTLKFQFPSLHNQQVFESDFFDVEGEASFWRHGLKFDWVVGNPPWIKANPKSEKFAHAWINSHNNKSRYPTGGNRVAEALSWLVTELLQADGIAGLILPATSLFNLESKNYRRQFFAKHQVYRITNFANLREVLFDKRGTLPAATVVYCRAVDTREKPYIIHYGPFSVNQISEIKGKPWILTINENEIQAISPYEAERGESSLWKFTLWGNYQDKRIIERIKSLFPTTLQESCEARKAYFREGSQLRVWQEKYADQLEYIPELKTGKIFRTDLMRQLPFRFAIPQEVLQSIPDDICYIRKQGGKAGLEVTKAPHIILSPSWGSYIVYSDQDFVIPPRQMGIAASEKYLNYLRALSVYLSSGLVAYYLFFHSQEWGIFRQAKRVSTTEVRKVPTPEFTIELVKEPAALQKELVKIETQEISNLVSELRRKAQKKIGFDDSRTVQDHAAAGFFIELTTNEKVIARRFISKLRARLQKKNDEAVFNLFRIPEDIRLIVSEFIQLRLFLDKPSAIRTVIRKPTTQELLANARELRNELDDFVMGAAYHRIMITYSDELIQCVVESTNEAASIPIGEDSIKEADLTLLNKSLREQVGQWVYIQRGLRIFDGPRIHIYKSSRLIDWTRTQALNDAGDIIGEAVSTGMLSHDDNQTGSDGHHHYIHHTV